MGQTSTPRLAKLAAKAAERLEETNRATQLVALRRAAVEPRKNLAKALSILKGDFGATKITVSDGGGEPLPKTFEVTGAPITCAVHNDTVNLRASRGYQIAVSGMEFVIYSRTHETIGEPLEAKIKPKSWEELARFKPGETPNFDAIVADAEEFLASQLENIGKSER